MKLLDILSVDGIKAPMKATEKHGAIDELIDLLASTGRVKSPAALKDAVWTREQTRTTGIGHGLAIPHGKSPGVDSLVIAVGKPAAPMDFGAIDAKPVRLIVLLSSPPEKSPDHIQALAQISRMMMNDDFRQKIYAANTPAEIYELIKVQEQGVPTP
jgi:fructose-specific phosphotransferase system IIA component